MKINRVLLLSLLFLLSLVSCSRRTYTIGVITNLEGSNVQSSNDAFRSVKMAYEEARQEYKGLEIQILPIDNSDDPKLSAQAYNRIADKCDAFIIITTSTAFLPLVDLIHKHSNKLHFLIGATTTAISGQDDNIIRNTVDMIREQHEIADFITRHNGKPLPVIMETGKNGSYTRAAIGYFQEFYKGEIGTAEFSATGLDFTKAIEKVKEMNCDYVYVLAGGTPREAGILIQKIHELDPSLYVVTTPWVRGEFFIQALGKYSDRVIVSAHISMANKLYGQFEKKFRSENGRLPAYQAPLSYDASKILFEALSTEKTSDAKRLKEYILSRTYPGTTGTLKFDKYGDVQGNLYFYKITGTGYEEIP